MAEDNSGFSRVLVPLDGSAVAEQAIPYAAALAPGRAEIVFLQVILEVEPHRTLLGKIDVPVEEAERNGRAQSLADLRETAARWAGVLAGEPAFEVAVGDAAEQIIAAATRLSCDAIVAASHGHGGIARAALGSVADSLSRTSPLPVLLVRAREDAVVGPATIDRIVAPYDGSELAATAIPVAVRVARQLGAGIFLIRAVDAMTYAPMPLAAEPFAAPLAYGEVMEEIEKGAEESLRTLAAELEATGVLVVHAVVTGPPGDAIVAHTRPEDLIVMASHGRSGLKRFLLGSVAQHVVREGPAPVLLVPAAGRRAG